MIYNLVEYLITELPSIMFTANGFNPDSIADEVMVRDSGGDPKHWYDRTDWTVQIISRSMNVDLAKRNVDAVYNLLKNKFGVQLPAKTVAGVVYPAMQTYQISPTQTPGYLGADDKHLEMFVFNLIITTK
jgi:hypothetical protein